MSALGGTAHNIPCSPKAHPFVKMAAFKKSSLGEDKRPKRGGSVPNSYNNYGPNQVADRQEAVNQNQA